MRALFLFGLLAVLVTTVLAYVFAFLSVARLVNTERCALIVGGLRYFSFSARIFKVFTNLWMLVDARRKTTKSSTSSANWRPRKVRLNLSVNCTLLTALFFCLSDKKEKERRSTHGSTSLTPLRRRTLPARIVKRACCSSQFPFFSLTCLPIYNMPNRTICDLCSELY